MEIVVCVKQVPDTNAVKSYGPDLRFDRSQSEAVVNPFDEYAIEEALRLREAHEGTVTVITMGPDNAEDVLRKTLAMGADKAVLISDPALAGSDWLATSRVLASVIRSIDSDVILCGMESTDARTGLVPAGLAEILDLPALTYASRVEVQGDEIVIDRQVPGGTQQVSAQIPAVVSVVKGVNEPRYPSLKGIMAAKRKEVRRMALSDIDVEATQVGYEGSLIRVLEATERPEKAVGDIVSDDAADETARKVADFLQAKHFI